MWCCGSGSQKVHPVPVPVTGNFTEPFFLVSTRDKNGTVTLRAVPTTITHITIPIVCMVDEAFFKDCYSGVKPGLQKVAHMNETGSFDQKIKDDDEYFDEMAQNELFG